MLIVFVVLVAAVLFAVVAVTLGRGDLLDDESAAADVRLPESDMSVADVEGLRFAIVQRGYRMDQVDAAVDRLSEELVRRDERITDLETRLLGGGPAQPMR